MGYFKSYNKFFHGIMFHHFHDQKNHSRGQGSINKDDFYGILKYIGRENIIDADEFIFRFKENKLSKNNVCITFDDALKCQYDVALPVLEDLKIKSFFFIYSSIFEQKPDSLEVYRYFRTNFYKNIEDFYLSFFKMINHNIESFFLENKKIINLHKNKFPHYSINDIKFRLIRDKLISSNEYDLIMNEMMSERNFKIDDLGNVLYMSKNNITELSNLGHNIGLHSHSHPTVMENLSFKDQEIEYKKNLQFLNDLISKNSTVNSMSHPCGSYNKNTLQILKKLKIEIGFKQIMDIEQEKGMMSINNSKFEIARQDHSAIMSEIL